MPSRKYKDTYSGIGLYKGRRVKYKYTKLRPGLKLVHIGEDVWRIGKNSMVGDPAVQHQVIYGPDNKEYHLYGDDVEFVNRDLGRSCGRRTGFNRGGNTSIQQMVKIYILTHILDSRANWCFDLNNLPEIGKLKVVYENGTVKNIEFDGEFKTIPNPKYSNWILKPFAYRFQDSH